MSNEQSWTPLWVQTIPRWVVEIRGKELVYGIRHNTINNKLALRNAVTFFTCWVLEGLPWKRGSGWLTTGPGALAAVVEVLLGLSTFGIKPSSSATMPTDLPALLDSSSSPCLWDLKVHPQISMNPQRFMILSLSPLHQAPTLCCLCSILYWLKYE